MAMNIKIKRRKDGEHFSFSYFSQSGHEYLFHFYFNNGQIVGEIEKRNDIDWSIKREPHSGGQWPVTLDQSMITQT